MGDRPLPCGRVAVFEVLDTYRRGLVSLLRDAGFEVVLPEGDPVEHVSTVDVFVLGVDGDPGAALELAKAAEGGAGTGPIVAMVRNVSVDHRTALVRAGVVPCPWDAASGLIVAAVQYAQVGWTLLPTTDARDLIHRSAPENRLALLTSAEVSILRMIAAGGRVDAIAEQFEVSERTMNRRIADLYATLGVEGRTDAIALAVAHGLR